MIRVPGRWVRGPLAVATAVLALSGCGVYPGAAAVVGDTRISDDRVEAAAAALCSANIEPAKAQGRPAPELPARGALQAAVQLLVDSELSRQYGEAHGIEPRAGQVSAALAQNAATTELLPPGRREAFEELLRGYAEGQLVLIEAGRRSLAEQGQPVAPDDAAIAEGTRLRDEWARSVEVEVDPRYGTFRRGTLAASNGSLSVPASDRAVQGMSPQPSPEWVSGLPATQKCS